jgi:hypothetical protein
MQSLMSDKLFPFLVMLWQVIGHVEQKYELTRREILLGLISTVYKTGLDKGYTVPDIDAMIRHVRLTYGQKPEEN